MTAGTALALALGLGFTADRITEARAADRLADRLRCAANLSTDPDVSFEGIPFLTQSVRRAFDTVHAHVPQVTLGPFTVAVDATGHDVSLADGGTMRAGSLTADITFPYAGLGAAKVANGPEGSAAARYGTDGSGRLTVQMQVELLGRSQPVIVYASPKIAGDALIVQPEEVGIPILGFRLPAERLGDEVRARAIALPRLPAGLHYAKAGATGRGLRLTVTGSDLHLTSAGAGDTGGKCDQPR